jgi:hypothetical protein
MQNNVQLRPLQDRPALQNVIPPRQKKRKEDEDEPSSSSSKVESVHAHEVILIDSDDDLSDCVQIVNNDNGAKWPSPLPNNNNKACVAKNDIPHSGPLAGNRTVLEENGNLSESGGPKLECPICFDLVPFSNGSFLECEVMLTYLIHSVMYCCTIHFRVSVAAVSTFSVTIA